MKLDKDKIKILLIGGLRCHYVFPLKTSKADSDFSGQTGAIAREPYQTDINSKGRPRKNKQ